MKVETLPIHKPKLDPENARTHPVETIEAIKESLVAFGQVLPIVLHDGYVVGGNGTLTAMRDLGLSEVRVVHFGGTKQEAKALALALNRTAELAEWDADVLSKQLSELAAEGVDLGALGFEAFPEFSEDIETDFRIAQPELVIEEKKPKKEKEEKAPIIQYALIFDNEDQQKRFFALMSKLKEMFPDAQTNAARLDQVVSEILTPES